MQLAFLVCLTIFYRISNAFPESFGEHVNANPDGITRFFVIADWGGLPFLPYETPSENSIAKAMGKLGVQLNTSFQLALGDNFYFDGVHSATDARFEVIYTYMSFFITFTEFSRSAYF